MFEAQNDLICAVSGIDTHIRFVFSFSADWHSPRPSLSPPKILLLRSLIPILKWSSKSLDYWVEEWYLISWAWEHVAQWLVPRACFPMIPIWNFETLSFVLVSFYSKTIPALSYEKEAHRNLLLFWTKLFTLA